MINDGYEKDTPHIIDAKPPEPPKSPTFADRIAMQGLAVNFILALITLVGAFGTFAGVYVAYRIGRDQLAQQQTQFEKQQSLQKEQNDQAGRDRETENKKHDEEVKATNEKADKQFNAQQGINKENLKAVQNATAAQREMFNLQNRARLDVYQEVFEVPLSSLTTPVLKILIGNSGNQMALDITVKTGIKMLPWESPLPDPRTFILTRAAAAATTLPINAQLPYTWSWDMIMTPQTYSEISLSIKKLYFMETIDYTDQTTRQRHHVEWCTVYNPAKPTDPMVRAGFCALRND